MLISYYRHELHTSLNAIIGYSELLLEDAESSGLTEVEHGLNEILQACRALLTFARELLNPNRLRELDADTLPLVTQKMHSAGQQPIQQVMTSCARLMAFAEQAGMYGIIPDLCKIQASGNMLQSLLDAHNSILLPSAFKSPPASGSAALAELAPAARPGGKILIIDDNSMNRDLLRQWLERHGYHVEEASGGNQGLEYIQEQSYDLVLLDLRMPDLSGLDVLRQLKEQGRLPGLPVVMLSASDEVSDVASCIEYGALDYLVKPVNLTVLGIRIRSYLERQQRLALPLQPETRRAEVSLFPDVTLLYAAFSDCSHLYKELSADVFIAHLNRFSALAESLSTRYAVTQISSSLVACIAVANLATDQLEHASVTAALAESLRQGLGHLNRQHGISLSLHIGVHSGPILAGVLDPAKPAYGIWGDTFRIAQRLSTAAPPGEVYLSAETQRLLNPTLRCEECSRAAAANGESGQVYRLLPAQGNV